MTDGADVRAADERPHRPGGARGWAEAWHLDVATEDGVGLAVTLATWPGRGAAWWWTYLFRPDLEGPVVVRDHEVPLPRQGLEVRGDGLWGELVCETPLEHWTYGLEAFGVVLDRPADALRGERGERLPIGFDLEWEVDGDAPPRACGTGGRVNGYSQHGIVRGELLLGRARYEVVAVSRRTHVWGEPRLDVRAHSAWFHAPGLDGSFGVVDGAGTGSTGAAGIGAAAGELGEIVRHARPDLPVRTVHSETRRDSDGLPVAARHVIDDALEIGVEVLGIAPIPVVGAGGERAVLARALCRYELGGTAVGAGNGAPLIGNGWSSWLDAE